MDNEKIQNFADMVEATDNLSRPWRKLAAWLLAALVATNLIWGFVHWRQLKYAYMSPVEVEQGQQFDQHTQNQSYKEGATSGN